MARTGILISGYYGFGNIGDEAVLAGMLAGLRARLPGVDCTVLSADPEATRSLHGTPAVDRARPGDVLRAMRGARLFISGGGSLIQDVTSVRSALYYLGVLGLASVVVPRTMVYAHGVGPLTSPVVRRLTSLVLKRADAVTVRDAASAALLAAIGVPATVVADPAWVLAPAPAARAEALVGPQVPAGTRVVGAVVRAWRGDAYLTALAGALARSARDLGGRIVIIPFHPAEDLGVSRRLAAATGGGVLDIPLTPPEAMAVVGMCTVLVTVRLHGLVFAAQAGVPVVALGYDPKMAAAADELGLDPPVALEADADTLTRAVHAALAGRDHMRSRVADMLPRLRRRAEEAADAAAAVYLGQERSFPGVA